MARYPFRALEAAWQRPWHAVGLDASMGRVVPSFIGKGERSNGAESAKGHGVVAIDPCPAMLTLASENTSAELLDRIEFVEGNAIQLDFPAASVDAISACASLLHLSRIDLRTAMTECRRVMKSNGVLGICMRGGAGETNDEGRLMGLWDKSALEEVVSRAGFVIEFATTEPSLDGRYISWIRLVARAI